MFSFTFGNELSDDNRGTDTPVKENMGIQLIEKRKSVLVDTLSDVQQCGRAWLAGNPGIARRIFHMQISQSDNKLQNEIRGRGCDVEFQFEI